MLVLLRILRVALNHKWRLVGAYACMIGATIVYLVLPNLFGNAVDRTEEAYQSGSFSDSTVLWLVVLIIAMSGFRGVLSFGQTYMAESLGLATVYDLRNRFYDHVQRLSFGFHDHQHTGNLMSRAITDVEAIRMFINAGMIRTPYFIALLVVVPFILMRLDWRMGLLGISFLPFVGILSGFLRLYLRRIWLSVQEKMAELSTTLQENLSGVRVVKAFASEEYEEAKFDEKNKEVAEEMLRAARVHAFNSASMVLTYLIVTGLILWYGGSRVIDGHITLGEIAKFLFYLQILSVPIRSVGMMVSNYARTMSAGGRLFEILDAESPVRESENAFEIARVRGHVRFENVSFSYKDGITVLKNIDIDAEPGQVVALVGAPGSGKSSIVNLISRFYNVDSGSVNIDGIDVRDVTLKSLRKNIGLVQQDVFLFTASVRENIAYGRPDATMEEVKEAARVAQMEEFVEDLEDGYDTELGERGTTLSGGQRQRLSIARAVLLDPPILILDDSTSSVDAHTEELIRKAMESVMRGRTTFVIAHRLSTVHGADQILVLRDGRIAERGTHAELLAASGLYREIYDLQLRPQEDVMLEFDVSATGASGKDPG